MQFRNSLIALAALSVCSAHAASPLIESIPVKITNTPANAVPVTGSVSVTNSVPVTGTVNVGSMPPVTGNVSVTNTVPVTGSVSVSNTVPVTGTVSVGAMPPVTGSVTVTNTVPVTGTVNVGSMPPVTVSTGHDANHFVVPFSFDVQSIDYIAVSLNRPAILESVLAKCDGSLVGTSMQLVTDTMMNGGAYAFDAPPAGTQLLARDNTSGNFSPQSMGLNYPAYEYQLVQNLPTLTGPDLVANQLNMLVLADVTLRGLTSQNSFIYYCWGTFLFRKL